VKDVLKLQVAVDAAPVIPAAFKRAAAGDDEEQAAKGVATASDTVEKCEFRMFLVYIRQFLEIFCMFDQADTGGTGDIDVTEFTSAVPALAKFGAKIDDPKAEFAKIDKGGEGSIDFEEFADWALKQGLDLGDGDDFEDDVLKGVKQKRK